MGRPQLIGRATEEMSQTADGRNLGKLAKLSAKPPTEIHRLALARLA